MTITRVVLLVMGSILILSGSIGYILCRLVRPLHDAEIEGMKQNGLFEGEPEYMRSFRVTRAEFDLESNLHYGRYALIALVVGIAISGCLIIF